MPPPKVLLVDDDPALVHALEQVLNSAGYGVRWAGDGRAAISLIERDCPNIVITDWDMPFMNGMELCRWLRGAARPHYVYTIVLTAGSDAAAQTAGFQAGADDFLHKPVRRDELLARLNSALRFIELEQRLTDLAKNDLLTGIPTRRTFYEQLAGEFAAARRDGSPLACVMLDIDYFKRVNDTYGHAAGDAVLKVCARLLTASCQAGGLVCRHGGEEFCILLPRTDEGQALAWANATRRAIAAEPFHFNGRLLRLTASFGAAQCQDDMDSPDALIDHADQALLVAKQTGRDRAIGYSALDDLSAPGIFGPLGDPFEGVLARDVMASPVACLRAGQTVSQAADFFCRLHINAAPVVDDLGRLTGVLSEKDVLGLIVSPDAWRTTVETIMKTHVVCYDEDTPLRRIYDFLCRVTLRRVIIVRDGYPTGVIGRGILLGWFHNWLRANGLVSMAGGGDGQQSARGRMQLAAESLVSEAQRLHRHLASDPSSLIPGVVSGASHMQELLDDLLANSRFTDAISCTTRHPIA